MRNVNLFRFIAASGMLVLCPHVFTAEAVAQTAINGPLRVSSVNPRYFTDNTGKAIYLTGSNSWANFQDLGFTDPPAAFDNNAHLNFLTNYNHNFIRLWVFENTRSDESSFSRYHRQMIYPRTGPGNANDGNLKFNVKQFDQSYFDRLRQRVMAARDRGIYVDIMFFEGFSVWNRGGNPWRYHPYNEANNISGVDGDINNNNDGEEVHSMSVPATLALQEAYVKKVIDTVNDLDNVLFEISNEDDASASDWQNYLINFIKTYEQSKPKQHMVGKTSIGGYPGNPLLYNSPADWVSPSAQNYGSTETAYASNPPASTGMKVELLDTDHIGRGMYETDGNFARAWVWKSFSRGYNPIYLEVLPNSKISTTDYTASWGEPPPTPARHAMGYTLAYARKLNLVAMTPQGSLSSTTYCLASVGNEYLVYQPIYTSTTNSTFTVNLAAGTYNYEWFNPVSGQIASTGTVTASGGNKSFAAPFSRDAVLYLKAVSTTPTTFTNKNLVAVGKCLTATGATPQSNVFIDQCDGRALQQWTYTSSRELRNGSLCLDVAAASTTNGGNVQVYTCNSANNQKWERVGNAFKPLHVSGLTMCMDVTGGSSTNGTNVQIYTCNSSSAQNWMAQDPPSVQVPLPPSGLRLVP